MSSHTLTCTFHFNFNTKSISPLSHTMLRQEWRPINSQNTDSRSMYEAIVASVGHPSEGGTRVSAKASLHQLCSAKHWKNPQFECCNEEGPSHHKMFIFKVTVITEEGRSIIESFGNPQRSKKAAAEEAAEGALWYLKNMGIE